MKPSDELVELIGPYLSRQRWAVRGDTDLAPVEILDHEAILDSTPALLWLLVGAAGSTYQLLVGLRPEAEQVPAGERDILGTVSGPDGPLVAYDALIDPELSRLLASRVVEGGLPEDAHVRSVGAEQSNSSIVFDERVIVKFYRRLQRGVNPDVEVATGLDRVGFNHLASPLGVWHRDEYDLAVAQEFLAGGTEGWALALTSLRDLYACDDDDPAAAGGDFGAESRRLGEMTAKLHLALAEAFGTSPADTGEWLAEIEPRLAGLEAGDLARARALAGRVTGLDSPGPSIRVHGDYHLGQVMRTETGWFVLDFEGEPARPLETRRRPWPALKDVAGMLRSFGYAAAVALADRGEATPELAERGRSWERHNRGLFLDGYLATPGVEDLVPQGEAFDAVLAFFELDKALYELGYERAHRPEWTRIPLAAIDRLLTGG
ncbi:MAG TPA: phosphotransferase [Acidimicrobiales bacterium]|nr:phosphotransferase [Acidimicrobiales bacterium]